ncbi:ankyrin repeat-containing domain protein, partial [Terfezia claveryi]
MTAIHYAAVMGYHKVVKYLLGEKPELINVMDKEGDAPLHCAAAGGRVEVVQLLLDHYRSIDRNRGCSSDCVAPPISDECERRVVELLLDSKANIEATDKDQETPLHVAARWGRLTIAETLLKRLPLPPAQPSDNWEKANIRARDIHKDTPLHLAARWGHQEMVRVLLYELAPLDATNEHGFTPRQVAEDH